MTLSLQKEHFSKLKFILGLLILLVYIPDNAIGSQLSIKGSSQIEYRMYESDNNSQTQDENLLFINKIQSDYKKGNQQFRSRLWFQQDSINKASTTFAVEELYLSYQQQDYDLFMGAKVINWSTLEVFHPTNFINSRNYDSSLISPVKIGEPMIGATYYFSTLNLNFFYMPYIINPIFADVTNRLRAASLPVASPRYFDKSSIEITQSQLFQYALKSDFTYKNTDVNLFFSDHMDRLQPLITLDNGALVPNYFRLRQVGFSSESAFKDILVKFEYTYKDFIGSYGSLKQKDHSHFATGTEYTYIHRSGLASTFIAEYSIIPDLSKQSRSTLGILQNDITFLYNLSFNNEASTLAQVLVLKDLDVDSEYLMLFKLSQRFFNRLIGSVGVQWITSKSSTSSGLKNLEDADYTYVSITNYF